MKNELKPLAKNVLIPIESTAAVSATDAAINKKMFRWSVMLTISNNEMNDIMKIANSLEESGLLKRR